MLRARFYGLLVCLLCSCERLQSCGSHPLAELTSARGDVSRDHRGHEQDWAKAEVGSAFSYGDALRTAKGSLAEVRVGQSGRLQVESETIVRFLAHVGAGNTGVSELQVSQGSAVIEAGTQGLTLRTRSGTAVLDPDSKLLLTRAVDSDEYRVLMGGAMFHQDDGQTISVAAGHSLAIGIGKAVLDEEPPKSDAPSNTADSTPPPAASQHELQTPDDSQELTTADSVARPVEQRAAVLPMARDAEGSSAAEVAAASGESFEVYDPAPPTQIALTVPERCEHGAELILSRGRSVRGATRFALNLPAGVYRYKVYCLDKDIHSKPAAIGVIEIRKANGTRALPKSAPHNTLDLDGHSYRLIYQNLRPEVSVSWPDAPEAAGYTLLIRSPSGETRKTALTRPQYVLPVGTLSDGKHTLVMEANGTSASHSKATAVNITYDDSAPTANLELPAASGFVTTEPIEVRGVAAEGTSVSVDGEPLKPNVHGSFRQTLALSPGRTALSVRFQHQTHRVRYYVRRARPAAQ